jgi:hypothetical protein
MMAGAAGIATAAFGTGAGTDRVQVVVTGQTGLVSGDHVEAWVMRDVTAEHNADEHELLARDSRVLAEVSASSELTVTVVCETTWTGDFKVHWVWNNA